MLQELISPPEYAPLPQISVTYLEHRLSWDVDFNTVRRWTLRFQCNKQLHSLHPLITTKPFITNSEIALLLINVKNSSIVISIDGKEN